MKELLTNYDSGFVSKRLRVSGSDYSDPKLNRRIAMLLLPSAGVSI